jgi:hypothetical protein
VVHRYCVRFKVVLAGAAATLVAWALAAMFIAPGSASAGCPIWNYKSCYHYGGTFKTKRACEKRGSYLEFGTMVSGMWFPGFTCTPVPPRGHYDLYYWTP